MTKVVPLRVWDWATGRWARVVEFERDEETGWLTYRLDDSVPLTPEYPTAWRNQGEVSRGPTTPPTMRIFGPEDFIELTDPES